MNSTNSPEKDLHKPDGSAPGQKLGRGVKEPEELIRARQQFTVLFMASFVSMFLPLPFRMVAAVFSLWALALAVSVIIKTWRSDTPNQNLFSMISGAVVALLITTLIASTATRWTLDMNYQTCQREALTHSAMQKCTDQYRKDLKDATTRVVNP